MTAVLSEQGSPEKKEGEAARFAGIGGPARAIYSQWGGISKMRAQEMCLTSLWEGSGGGEGDPRRAGGVARVQEASRGRPRASGQCVERLRRGREQRCQGKTTARGGASVSSRERKKKVK